MDRSVPQFRQRDVVTRPAENGPVRCGEKNGRDRTEVPQFRAMARVLFEGGVQHSAKI